MTCPDPPTPPGRSCAECGGLRAFDGLKPLYRDQARVDPFCSAKCARAWHGVPLPPPQPREPGAYVSKLPPAA